MDDKMRDAVNRMIGFLGVWIENRAGIKIDMDRAKIEPSARRDNPNGVHVSIPATGGGAAFDFFLRDLSLRFSAFEQNGVLWFWRIGIDFAHRDGGGNGWSCDAVFAIVGDEPIQQTRADFIQR